MEGAGGLPSGAGPTAVVVLPWVDCKELKLKGWTTDLSPVGALGKEDIPENSMQPYFDASDDNAWADTGFRKGRGPGYC